ncbi:DNA-directed RNA polymerase sigma-70 factor [Clostridium zeae]|uniref:DNA-directed RNA polymerase sigma-70 factor n=1 Tax=Clostridium zeae TaxID=2759022 RepID=A0ABQ1E6S2_9CLOT|nr:sigma-70 family RNA polymerase sigma factor [Clostridium zeae]GFZ30431.1 DNA-directed RNA polymerase sigma-70 factor [Clostridium zeae]
MKISEDNLVKELKSKNPKALDYVVKNYSNLIFKVIISVIGSAKREEAMECLNDVLLKVWEKISYHDETKNKFSSWLIAVSKYNALDYKRKLSKTEEESNIEELMLADEKQVEEQILCNENRQELLKVIDTLGSPDKDIFIRKYFMGESINDISEALNLSKPAIKNRLFRGRKVLKDKLNPIEMEAL